MKFAANLPTGFVFELTSLIGRLIGELAVDYGLEPNVENLASIRQCVFNIAVSLTVLDKSITKESLKKEVNELIDMLDLEKLQDAYKKISVQKNLPDFNQPVPPKKDMN